MGLLGRGSGRYGPNYRTTHTRPEHCVPVAPEGHAEVGEVPQNGAKGMEPLDTQDDVEAIQGKHVHVDAEVLPHDVEVCTEAHTTSHHTLPIDDFHSQPMVGVTGSLRWVATPC
jgi:hypothetical protein